ncbi:MAG TPA: sugar phosphate isomerase/epimerase family protein [Terriglobales bacterium]|nr:sugar phosphate isomerase/epimerase family protein [Terriglobales bacterium]
MLRAMSTYVYVKQRLHPGLLETLTRGGAQAIEIFAARQHLDYANRKSHVREIAQWFQSTGVPLNSVHSPMFSDYDFGRSGSPPVNIADTDRARRIEAMDEIKRALEIAEQIPFRFLVQHIGNGGEEFSDKKMEAAMTSIEHLRAFAKPLGVQILVENIPNELSTPEKLVEFIRASHLEDVGVCFDVGHAHLAGGVVQAFEILKDHIRSTHVHDNAGDRDSHLWPTEGSIDWTEAMGALGSAPQVPPLLMEIDGEDKTDVSKQMSEAFRTLEQAAGRA